MGMIFLEAAALAAALSLDSFVACFGYGSNNIRIPWLSALVVDGVCSLVVGLSLWVGALARPYLPVGLTKGLCVSILLMLGMVKLLDSLIKSLIRRCGGLRGRVGFSLFSVRLVLTVYADPEAADQDHSKTLSPAEAFSLAVALSLDGMAVGFGAALGQVNGVAVVLCSLITGAVAVAGGCKLGNRVAKALPFNISWLGGAVLILLALAKL